MKKLSNLFIFLFTALFTNAQVATANNSNELMYKDGKIYVVVAVLVVILVGLFFYVWTLDRKISKMEKEN